MIKTTMCAFILISLIFSSQTTVYASQSSQNAIGHVIIKKVSLKLIPSSGVVGSHVLIIGTGFVPYHVLDLTFTDSNNHIFKLGKTVVYKHGEFVKHVIIPKKVAIGKGFISAKDHSITLATSPFTVLPNHHHDDSREEKDDKNKNKE